MSCMFEKYHHQNTLQMERCMWKNLHLSGQDYHRSIYIISYWAVKWCFKTGGNCLRDISPLSSLSKKRRINEVFVYNKPRLPHWLKTFLLYTNTHVYYHTVIPNLFVSCLAIWNSLENSTTFGYKCVCLNARSIVNKRNWNNSRSVYLCVDR